MFTFTKIFAKKVEDKLDKCVMQLEIFFYFCKITIFLRNFFRKQQEGDFPKLFPKWKVLNDIREIE
jgi:hypothetical protein